MISMNNLEFKEYCRANGIRLWEVALRLGISEATITRWLRIPLPEAQMSRLMQAVRMIAAERGGIGYDAKNAND